MAGPLSTWVGWPVFFALCFVATVPSLVLVLFVPEDADRTGADGRRDGAMARRPSFVFAHGAGAPSSSAWMVAWRGRLGTLGDVVAFDYPYMRAGRKAPDRLPVLIAAHRAVLAEAPARADGAAVPDR